MAGNERDERGRFLPTVSGNPNGGSKRQRQTRQAREWISAISDNEIPETVLEAIRQSNPGFAELLPDGATFGFGQALRLNLIALTGNASESLSALSLMDRILPPVQHKPADLPPPILETTEEQRRAMAEELGIDPDSLVN